jgi:hypothetical protein
MRTIAATFDTYAAAEHARQGLLATRVHPDEVAIASAPVAASDDAPISEPKMIVAVLADGNAPLVRDALADNGGHVVADVEVFA